MSETESIESYGFTEARKVGDLLFCSGQIGLEADGSVPMDSARQFERAFAALADVLARHGCSAADIVDLTTFHVGYPDHMETFVATKMAFMPGANSCWTAVGVAALGYPGTLVEIKAIARIADRAA